MKLKTLKDLESNKGKGEGWRIEDSMIPIYILKQEAIKWIKTFRRDKNYITGNASATALMTFLDISTEDLKETKK